MDKKGVEAGGAHTNNCTLDGHWCRESPPDVALVILQV